MLTNKFTPEPKMEYSPELSLSQLEKEVADPNVPRRGRFLLCLANTLEVSRREKIFVEFPSTFRR